MNPENLIASAAINFGLAILVLSLFSILKKQPSNAPVYYARRLSLNHQIHFDHRRFFSPSRYLPSFSWISRAFRVLESKILHASGLDALLVIRLFKFGLWIHFACLWFISLYALYLLYMEYNEILMKRIQQLQHIKDRPDQFTVLVREIPLCTEHKARACSVDHFFSKHYPRDYHSYQILYHGKDVEELMKQAKSIARKINKLKERSAVKPKNRGHFPLDKSDRNEAKLALQEEKLEELRVKINQWQCENTVKQKETKSAMSLIRPGLKSVVTGFLPSAILKGFIYIVPFAMHGMAKLDGSISKSKDEIKTCNMVFYFLVGNVFFLNMLSGSLLNQISESFSHPKDCPTRLAIAVSAQADFFMTYVLTYRLLGFSLEILQPGLLPWDCIKSCLYFYRREKNPAFLIGYFCLGYLVC